MVLDLSLGDDLDGSGGLGDLVLPEDDSSVGALAEFLRVRLRGLPSCC